MCVRERARGREKEREREKREKREERERLLPNRVAGRVRSVVLVGLLLTTQDSQDEGEGASVCKGKVTGEGVGVVQGNGEGVA